MVTYSDFITERNTLRPSWWVRLPVISVLNRAIVSLAKAFPLYTHSLADSQIHCLLLIFHATPFFVLREVTLKAASP